MQSRAGARAPCGTVVITGANGFLGRACCRCFTAAGFQVRALVRNPENSSDLQEFATGGLFRCELPDDIDESAFEDEIQAWIHCAFATTQSASQEIRRGNLEGAEALLRLARRAGVQRNIFISSLAAHEEARSGFGQAKLQVERFFTAPEDTVIKPGIIIGKGGLFQRIRDVLRRWPVVPLLFSGGRFQVVWIDDVCDGILAAVTRDLSGTLVLAHPQPVPIPEFYRRIAALNGRKPLLVPFPGDLALWLISHAEMAGIPLPMHSDNLLGIKHLHFVDARPDLERLGLRPISFEEALARLKP